MSPRVSFSRYQSYTAQKDFQKKVGRLILFFLILFFTFTVTQGLFLKTYRVSHESLLPNYEPGDHLLFSPLPIGGTLSFLPVGLPGWRGPARGELAELVPPYRKDVWNFFNLAFDFVRFFTFQQISLERIVYPSWDEGTVIRRVVGVPGDTLYLKDYIAYVKPQDSDFFQTEFELSEVRYDITSGIEDQALMKPDFPFSGTSDLLTLGEGEFYLLADHRTHGGDSRSWGPIERRRILSIFVARYWPWK